MSKAHECGADEVGELLIRGPHVCGGYWKRPAETAKAIVDGWLHTGDLARRDSEGYYSIVGRSKDLIISGGENIYPAEVESVLHAHPAVAEAALIGVPDEKWGEVGRAIVVRQNGCCRSPLMTSASFVSRVWRATKSPSRLCLSTRCPRRRRERLIRRCCKRSMVDDK